MVAGYNLVPISQTPYAFNYMVKQNCHGFPVTQHPVQQAQQVQQHSQWLLANTNQVMVDQVMAQHQVPMVQQQVPMIQQQVPMVQQQVPMIQQQVPMVQQVSMVQQPSWCQMQSYSPSPSQSTTPSHSPSPAPMVTDYCPDLNLGATTQNHNVLLQDVEFDGSWELIYELPIIRHDATIESIAQNYGGQIADGFRAALGVDIFYLFVVPTRNLENNKMAIQWFVHPRYHDVKGLIGRTQVKDFKNNLICHLAGVGGGAFNKHLHASKQLTIVKKGFEVAQKLGRTLVVSDQNRLDSVLNAAPREMFDEDKMEQLFAVCDHPEGQALRGPTVVGAHFRGLEVSTEMVGFVDTLLSYGAVQRSSMIASMKGKKGRKQYKGWSIYIETPSEGHVNYFIDHYKALFARKKQAGVGKDFQIFPGIDRQAQHNQLN